MRGFISTCIWLVFGDGPGELVRQTQVVAWGFGS